MMLKTKKTKPLASKLLLQLKSKRYFGGRQTAFLIASHKSDIAF